uniref:Import receptor subunit TOM70-like n=1 Tax=Hirondellea gigas TaxID=1518452 RepID=A0A2P2I3H9_9CRUS
MASSKYLIADDAGIPKWKIALVIGGAAVVGAGIYYTLFRKQGPVKGSSKKASANGPNKTSNGISAAQVDNSPLGQAKQHKNDGNVLFRNGKYEEAILCYEKAIVLCPSSAGHDLSTFYQNRAAAHEHLKDWSNVMKDCGAALELNPRYTKALMRRARAAETLKDLDLALEDYTAICIIETFNNQESLNIVDRILKQIGMSHASELFGKKRDALPSVHSVRSHLNSFCCDPVTNSVKGEKEADDLPEGHTLNSGYLSAREHLRAENYNSIIECCSNELDNPLSSYTAHALLLRGTMLALLADREAALVDLNKLADMDAAPSKFRAAALVKLGALEVAFNNIEQASVIFNRALALDSNNSDVYHQLGQMNLLMSDVESAIESFKKGVELNPAFPIGLVQKLHTEYRYAVFKGDKATAQQALDQFKEAKEKFPNCSEVYLLLAQILVEEEQFVEADALFEHLLTVQPNTPVAYVYQGMMIVQWKGDVEQSKKLIKRALEMDPLCEMALENLATISVQTGNLEEGVRLFNRAIPLAKSLNEMAHYCSLRDAAVAQIKVVKRLGITLPGASEY